MRKFANLVIKYRVVIIVSVIAATSEWLGSKIQEIIDIMLFRR